MSATKPKQHQNATRKKRTVDFDIKVQSAAPGGAGESRLPVRLDFAAGSDDSLSGWLEAYFALEVTTAPSSRQVQRRDLTRFVRFVEAEEGSDARSRWTSRLTRAFIDDLRSELASGGSRYFSGIPGATPFRKSYHDSVLTCKPDSL